mgnify:CR=1 FL=1
MQNKIKVGIITYFYFYNYGTMLQGLATQLLFNKFRNIESEIIDFRFGTKISPRKVDVFLIRLKRIFVYIKEFKRVYLTGKYATRMSRRNRYFDKFVAKNVRLSSKKYMYEHEIIEDAPKYDIYVTGSDQTFSPKIGFSPALFLSFAFRDSVKAAYAPSLGVSSLTEEESHYIGEQLQKYDYLSCRESIGSNMLEKITGRKVTTVLDPTLMIHSEEWMRYAIEPNIKGRYILCYFLGDRDYYRDYVVQLSKQTSLPVYYIPANWKDFKKNNNLLWEVGPAEFLGLIANAEYICTDSFHGTLFSVNFHKEVRVFVKHAGNVNGGDNSRLFDVLKRMGIENQLITEYAKGTTIRESCIDYRHVDKLLNEERVKSMEYVESIVTSVKS